MAAALQSRRGRDRAGRDRADVFPAARVAAKPALAVALLLGAQSGEVLFNITNVQFVAAVALLQALFLTRPRSTGERALDLVVLALVGLTGPFSVIFAPFFAWRWWRDRHADNFAVLLVVAGCASLQGWFVLHGPAASAGPRACFSTGETPRNHFEPARRMAGRRGMGGPALVAHSAHRDRRSFVRRIGMAGGPPASPAAPCACRPCSRSGC